MTSPRPLHAFAWLGVCLTLVFAAASVEARGGGRGGGGRGGFSGGGRSISRSGPAASGGFRAPPSRPSSRPMPSTRPAPSARPAPTPAPSRPATPDTRPARPTAGTERPSQGGGERPPTGDREEAREDWQKHREDTQEDRQDYRDKAREDWQDYDKKHHHDDDWDDVDDVWIVGYPGYVVHDDDDVEWVTFLAGVTVGTALTSAAYQSMQTETACTPSEVVVNGVTYLKCGNTWYNRAMQGGAVSYVVVSAPPGF